MKKISIQLIEKFFRNECSVVEREQVLNYLKEHPEALNEFISEEEWEQFQTFQSLEEDVDERIQTGVHHTIFRRRRITGRIIKFGVAASLILFVGLAWMNGWFEAKQVVTNKKEAAIASVYTWTEKLNNSNKDSSTKLIDGTVAIMKPNSRIRYREPFVWENKREVFMQGIVSFHVAKDKSKPFTVFSGDIATTALGTLFTIDYRTEEKTITVKLDEGKVVIRSSDSVRKKIIDYFLLPGDKLFYNKETMLVSLIRNQDKNVLVRAGTPELHYNENRKPDWYEFNGTKLSEVFDQLSAYYNAPIYYYPADVKNRYYTGRMEKTDSLADILRDIALLNDLTVSKKNNTFTLKRKP